MRYANKIIVSSAHSPRVPHSEQEWLWVCITPSGISSHAGSTEPSWAAAMEAAREHAWVRHGVKL